MNAQHPPGILHTRALPATALALLCLFVASGASAQDRSNPLGTLIFEPSVAGVETATDSAPATGQNSPAPVSDEAQANDAASQDRAAFLSASIDDYLAAISESIEDGDTYSQQLSEQYEALGILQFQAGNYDAAIEAFEDAIHIQKVNKGLFNLDQSRLVEHLINTHVARGDFLAVDNHKHYLYYLQDKNLAEDDPRLIAAKLDWADWNVEAYIKGYRESFSYPVSLTDSVRSAQAIENRFQVNVPVQRPVDGSMSSPGASPAETVTDSVPVTVNVPLLNSNSVVTNAAVTDYNLRSIPFSLSNELVVNQRLHEAEGIYESVLETVERDPAKALAEQESLHLKLANINYLLKKELEKYETIRDRGSIAYNRVNQEFTSDASMMADRRYINTKNTYTRLVEDIENSADTSVLDKANAYISLGDMHLSFERPQRAYDAYSKAHELLINGGFSSAETARLLSPSDALAVPAYGIHNYSREFFGIASDTQIPWRGYIDVEFSKDRYGSASGINVLASSADTPAQVQSALVNYLRTQRFRPALENGRAVEQDNIRLRYNYYF